MSQTTGVSWAFLLLSSVAWMATGCATKGDLEALQREMQASQSTVKGNVEDLQRQMRTNSASVEALKGETKTGFEATKKQIEERERQLAQDIKVLQDMQGKISDALRGMEKRIAEHDAKQETLSAEQSKLHATVRSVSQTLIEHLRGEEARLRESLTSVQSELKQLGGAGVGR
jgi:chromosome segregation ATPase